MKFPPWRGTLVKQSSTTGSTRPRWTESVCSDCFYDFGGKNTCCLMCSRFSTFYTIAKRQSLLLPGRHFTIIIVKLLFFFPLQNTFHACFFFLFSIFFFFYNSTHNSCEGETGRDLVFDPEKQCRWSLFICLLFTD